MKTGLFAVLALLTVFAFMGCRTDSGSDDESDGPNVPPNVTTDTISVTFDLGGAEGTVPDAIVLEKGAEITADQIPDAPVWEGYTFEGWYNGEDKLEAGNSWQNDITFTAKWTEEGSGDPDEE